MNGPCHVPRNDCRRQHRSQSNGVHGIMCLRFASAPNPSFTQSYRGPRACGHDAGEGMKTNIRVCTVLLARSVSPFIVQQKKVGSFANDLYIVYLLCPENALINQLVEQEGFLPVSLSSQPNSLIAFRLIVRRCLCTSSAQLRPHVPRVSI